MQEVLVENDILQIPWIDLIKNLKRLSQILKNKVRVFLEDDFIMDKNSIFNNANTIQGTVVRDENGMFYLLAARVRSAGQPQLHLVSAKGDIGEVFKQDHLIEHLNCNNFIWIEKYEETRKTA